MKQLCAAINEQGKEGERESEWWRHKQVEVAGKRDVHGNAADE